MVPFFFLFRTLFISLLVIGIGVYVLSFYDENRYKAIKVRFYPYWQSAVSRVLTAEQTVQLEARLLMAGHHINQTIVNTGKTVALKSKQLYTYVTTDKDIQKYVGQAKKKALDSRETVRSRRECGTLINAYFELQVKNLFNSTSLNFDRPFPRCVAPSI